MLLFDSFRLIFKNTRLRVCTLGLFLSGVTFSATMPYRALIGIDMLKIPGNLYSIFVFATSFFSLLAGILIGYLSDKLIDRYVLVPSVALIGAIGFGLFYMLPTIPVFFFSHLIFIPIAGSLYGLFFAAVRSETIILPTNQRDLVASTVRAIFAISWVIVPVIMGFLLSFRVSVYVVYLIAACSCIINACLFYLFSVKNKFTSIDIKNNKIKIELLISKIVFWRLFLVGTIMSAHKLQEIIFALIITGYAGGKDDDVGLYSGLVALLEIPLMIFWGHLLRWISKPVALAIGAFFYAIYMVILSDAHSMRLIYLSIPINAIGSSVILSVTISYLQDIFENQPGLSASLNYVAWLIGAGISAFIFGYTASIINYSQAAIIGAILVLVGGVGLVLTERFLHKLT